MKAIPEYLFYPVLGWCLARVQLREAFLFVLREPTLFWESSFHLHSWYPSLSVEFSVSSCYSVPGTKQRNNSGRTRIYVLHAHKILVIILSAFVLTEYKIMALFTRDFFLEWSVRSSFPICMLNSSWSMFFGVFLSRNTQWAIVSDKGQILPCSRVGLFMSFLKKELVLVFTASKSAGFDLRQRCLT